MAARKLTTQQAAKLRELAARMADEDGASAVAIAEAWNEGRKPEQHLTARAVLYHLHALRRQHLAKAEDHTAALTDRTVRMLAARANADPRAVISWSGDEVDVRDSDELTEDEAAQISGLTIRKTTGKDGEATVEVKVELHNAVSAANSLLRFMHGSKLSITESGAIIRILQKSGDRDGLERIASGEDPVRVLVDRAPFLSLPDQEGAADG